MVKQEHNGTVEPEVLEPKNQEKSENTAGDVSMLIAAHNLNMDRPDKILELFEKHNPGFIKELSEEVLEDTRKFKKGKFRFGEVQAYTSLIWSVLTGAAVIGCLIWTVLAPSLISIFVILALIPFFAITQGQATGFITILSGVADFFRNLRLPSKKEDDE